MCVYAVLYAQTTRVTPHAVSRRLKLAGGFAYSNTGHALSGNVAGCVMPQGSLGESCDC